MADWTDLTSTVRRTKGECPPPLVGASVTLIGDAIYVFGGRPVHSREMVCTLYALDLRSLAWAQVWPSPNGASRGTAPRYFHSAQAWGDKLVVFGGQSFVAGPGGAASPNLQQGRLETLDELVIFDTKTHTWFFPSPSLRAGVTRPSPRYAHLSVVTSVASRPSPGFRDPSTHSSRLIVIGGQDSENNYLPDLAVLDLDAMEWIAEAPFPRKAGTYRSVACAAHVSVVPLEERMGSDGALLVHSAHVVEPTEDREEPVWIYSNSNFASPRRDLDLISTVHDSLTTPAYLSLSDAMHGDPSLPPGLRFPHAYLCGHHLVLSGAHVGVNRAEFVVWTLDVGAHDPRAPGRGGALIWTALPLEKVLGRGSWGPAVGWRNTLVVLGDAGRDMMEDYNARQTNFAQVAFVDLEGFGVYIPPPQPIPAIQQQLSLLTMSQPQLFDIEVICSDGERLGCSRRLLEARWPWLADELRAVEAKASAAVDAREQPTTTGSGAYSDSSDEEPIDGALARVASPVPPRRAPSRLAGPIRAPSRLFPVTPRSLELPLPSGDVKALLQYFHTLSLSTAQQRSLPVLTSLLAFTKLHDAIFPTLRALVVHALHETLDSNPAAGAKIYEAATLGDSVALQIRAMQVMLNVRRGSAASSAHSVEQRRMSIPAVEPRLSDHSQVSSSNHSAYSGCDVESSSTGHNTPESSVSAGHAPHYSSPSKHPVAPHAQAPLLLPLPPTATPHAASPNVPLPSTADTPMYGAGPSRSALPLRSGSLSASPDASHYSPRSTPSPVPPSARLPAPPRRASSPGPVGLGVGFGMGSISISSSTPARIAEAWREGEERDARQRAEALRLAAEADLARSAGALRLGGGSFSGPSGDPYAPRKGSVASEGAGGGRKGSVASAQTLGSIPETAYGPLNGAMNGGGFASSPTPSLGGGFSAGGGSGGSAGDAASVRTSGSRASDETRHSSEKAVAVAAKAVETTAKVVKKGLFSGLMGPTIHNAGTTKKGPTGPAPKRAYPRPTPRTAKGAQALARLEDQFELQSSPGSSSASFRS